MYYYDFLNKVIGGDSVAKARMIPYYSIDHVDSYEEEKDYAHEFKVDSVNSTKVYDVIIKNNGEDFYSISCTCPQYKKAQTCKHIAACFLYYRYEMMQYKKVDVYKESKEILDLFYEPIDKLKVKYKLTLKIDIGFYKNEIRYKPSIGTTKLYVLNNNTKLKNFIDCYYNGGEYSLGQKLQYSNKLYYFSEEDAKLIDYFASFLRNSYEPLVINETDVAYFLMNQYIKPYI